MKGTRKGWGKSPGLKVMGSTAEEVGSLSGLWMVKPVQPAEVKNMFETLSDEEDEEGTNGRYDVVMKKQSEVQKVKQDKKMARKAKKKDEKVERAELFESLRKDYERQREKDMQKYGMRDGEEEEVGRPETRTKLSILGVVEPMGVNKLEECEEWEELEMAVDSGAGETVIGEGMVKCVEVVEGEARKKGVKYEVADGTLIDNEGEKKSVGVTGGGVAKRVCEQVCGVSKSLLSVRKVTGTRNTVVFRKGYGWIEDDRTGERTWRRTGCMW